MPKDKLIILMRLESLKLAYETAHKIGGLSQMPMYSMTNSKESLESDIKDVFKLADMNLAYLLRGNDD